MCSSSDTGRTNSRVDADRRIRHRIGSLGYQLSLAVRIRTYRRNHQRINNTVVGFGSPPSRSSSTTDERLEGAILRVPSDTLGLGIDAVEELHDPKARCSDEAVPEGAPSPSSVSPKKFSRSFAVALGYSLQGPKKSTRDSRRQQGESRAQDQESTFTLENVGNSSKLPP